MQATPILLVVPAAAGQSSAMQVKSRKDTTWYHGEGFTMCLQCLHCVNDRVLREERRWKTIAARHSFIKKSFAAQTTHQRKVDNRLGGLVRVHSNYHRAIRQYVTVLLTPPQCLIWIFEQ